MVCNGWEKRWADRLTEKVTYRGGCPPKNMVLLESMTMKKEKNYKETFC